MQKLLYFLVYILKQYVSIVATGECMKINQFKMGKRHSRPPMVNLYGNQKAVWELAIRYCEHSYLMKKQAKKVMNQVEH